MWWWWRENNRNVVVLAYSSTIGEAVLKKLSVGRYGVDVGSMQGRKEVDVFGDGKIYRINEEVEVVEGK